jgi:hypothetical protein
VLRRCSIAQPELDGKSLVNVTLASVALNAQHSLIEQVIADTVKESNA